jgi:CubicO group peptidase (beta-lactamase class C family)
MKKSIFVFFLFISFGFSLISGQPIQGGKSLSTEELLAKKGDDFLEQWNKTDQPGCAVGAIKDGRLVYKRGFGLANLDYDVPNTTTTRFTVASVSKAFTAMSVALLAQQGKLSLDDEIQKYVPEMPKYEAPITIRHLLSHTSGIREYEALVFFGGLNPDNDLSDKMVLNILTRQKNISFKPGTKYQYSNSNFFLAGVIVGRVSGKSLREFADENIFKPLGMKNTLFFDNRFEVVKNRAQGYRVNPGSPMRVRSSLDDLVGDGGIMTTIEDLYLWDQNFYEPKVGTKELIAQITAPGTLNNGQKIGYGFGLFHTSYKGLPVIKHSGNQGGFRALIAWFPEQKFTSIALCNNTAILPKQIVEKLADIYLEGQFKPVPLPKNVTDGLPPAIELSEAQLTRYAGTYAHTETGRYFKLTMKNGKLVNSEFFSKEVAVKAVSENRLLVVVGNGVTELFPVLDKNGAVSEVRIKNDDGTSDVYFPAKAPVASPEKLSEYAGVYYSEELAADYRIVLKGNSLRLQFGETFDAPINSLYADTFAGPGGQVRFSFTRDEKGTVMGFIFNSELDDREVKGIVFKRRQNP